MSAVAPKLKVWLGTCVAPALRPRFTSLWKSVCFLRRQRRLVARPTLESSSYLISVCGLFLRGPRLALCSLREKGGRWN